MQTIQLNIYWVRHAESCSNYLQGHHLSQQPLDYNNPDNMGYGIKNIEDTRKAAEDYFKRDAEKETKQAEPFEFEELDAQEIGETKVSEPQPEYSFSRLLSPLKTIAATTVSAASSIASAASSKVSKTLEGMRAAVFTHPNLTYVGIQQAIELGHFYKDKEIKYVFTSSSLRTIMTALMAFRNINNVEIIVVPYLNEHTNIAGSYDSQNLPLDSQQLKRMVQFIKDWLQKYWNIYYDDIELINLLRNIKMAFNDGESRITNLRQKRLVQTIIEMIDAILNCKINAIRGRIRETGVTESEINDKNYEDIYGECLYIFGKINDIITNLEDLSTLRRDNFMPHYEKITTNPDIYKKFKDPSYNIMIEETRIFYEENVIDIQTILSLSYLREIINYRLRDSYGPPVNFKYLTPVPITDNSNINLFYQLLQRIFMDKLRNFNIRENLSVCVVSHGSMLRSYFSKKYTLPLIKMLNTQTYREILNMNYEIETSRIKNVRISDIPRPTNFNERAYFPHFFRHKYQNFEKLNMNLCNLSSIQGVVNYPLYSGPTAVPSFEGFKTVSGFSGNYVDLNPDVKFVYSADEARKPSYMDPRIGEITDQQIHKKYLKYKNKYLKLKQHLNI
jgi:hypothetical protein